MAIGKYKTLFKKTEVDNLIDDLKTSMNPSQITSFLSAAQQDLEKSVEVLEAKEAELFSNFGNIHNIDELNEHLIKYRNTTLNLSGVGLYQTYLFQLETANQVAAKVFNEAAWEAMEEMVGNTLSDDEAEDALHKAVMKKLNENLKGRGGRFSAEKGYTQFASIRDTIPSLFTQRQRDELEKIMTEKYANKPAVAKYLKEKNAITNNEPGAFTFNWFKVSKKMTPTQAQAIIESGDPTLVENINKEISNKIISDTPAEHQPLMRQVIDYILKQKPTAFFVGANIDDITGILGEIQALFYLCLFTQQAPGSNVQWRGGIIGAAQAGKKPHQDILFNQLGIQVKNTKADLINTHNLSVNFKDKTLDSFLNDLGVDENIRNIFTNYYGTYIFNIEYQDKNKMSDEQKLEWEKKQKRKKKKKEEDDKERYIAAPNDEFAPTRQNLLRLQSQIDILMSIFAATLMYMDIATEVNMSQNDANILYLLGGITAMTASSIIKQVKDQVDSLVGRGGSYNNLTSALSVKAQVNSRKSASTTTIVNALNNKSRKQNFSDSILASVVLKTSYLFNFEQKV